LARHKARGGAGARALTRRAARAGQAERSARTVEAADAALLSKMMRPAPPAVPAGARVPSPAVGAPVPPGHSAGAAGGEGPGLLGPARARPTAAPLRRAAGSIGAEWAAGAVGLGEEETGADDDGLEAWCGGVGIHL